MGAILLLLGLSLTPAQAAPPGQEPDTRPSAMRGEAVWAENCAPCHGVGGLGDGPITQSPQMAQNPPPDFTDRVAARERTLAEMFTVTQEGRMDNMMPPWGGRLSDEQIWDVVAYAQTFSISPDDVAAGGAIYQQQCADCHAADGSGAVPGVPDLSDAAAMADRSPRTLFEMVNQGRGDMPAFDDKLSEQEQWQVVDYLRTFSYEPVTFEGIIIGHVQHGITEQPASGVEVRLRRWQQTSELPPLVAHTDADGTFRFEGLDTRSHAFYQPEVIYKDVPFPAEFVSFEPGTTQLMLPLPLYFYASTTSNENIVVERFHFIIMSNHPGFLSILELYQFGNTGKQAYAGTPNEDGLRQTVRMALPDGAQNLSLQSGTLGVDFVETADGLAATAPVVPGGETLDVAFLYAVPYSGTTLSLDRPLYYETWSVNGLMMDVGAQLSSDVLTFSGERTAQGQTFLQFTGQDLEADQTFAIRLDDLDKIEFAPMPGGPGEATAMPSLHLKQTTLLWMILALGTVAILFGAGYPWLRPRLRSAPATDPTDLSQERQRLLLTLARLDEAHEAGKLNSTVYRRARARRKEELIAVLRRMQEEA